MFSTAVLCNGPPDEGKVGEPSGSKDRDFIFAGISFTNLDSVRSLRSGPTM
jgi:hypothetical protein